MQPNSSDKTGRWAEYYAVMRLLLKGYLPRAYRYKTPVGEIDLIVQRGRTLVFVEVKYRQQHNDAMHALQAKQAVRLQKAASHYLAAHTPPPYIEMRFDLVAVSRNGQFHHLDNIISQTP